MEQYISFLEKAYVIFNRDEANGYVVVMGVKGAVNTTEIGIFFVEINERQTRIEISSLSTHAKRIVAKDLFHGLDITFGYAPPDPEPAIDTPPEKTPKP